MHTPPTCAPWPLGCPPCSPWDMTATLPCSPRSLSTVATPEPQPLLPLPFWSHSPPEGWTPGSALLLAHSCHGRGAQCAGRGHGACLPAGQHAALSWHLVGAALALRLPRCSQAPAPTGSQPAVPTVGCFPVSHRTPTPRHHTHPDTRAASAGPDPHLPGPESPPAPVPRFSEEQCLCSLCFSYPGRSVLTPNLSFLVTNCQLRWTFAHIF